MGSMIDILNPIIRAELERLIREQSRNQEKK
jgi:hypothetical protein